MPKHERFSLANMKHLTYFVGLLIADGALCPKCLKGARRTSKNWARCRNEMCGHRFRRLLDVGAEAKAQRGAR
jgi:hypothetical protein